VHQHASCIVTQREVGIDTESYDVALKNTLRQAPDVILIGEIRTRETMQQRGDLRRDRPPLCLVYPAREQRQPGARPDPELLPGRCT
jgi:Tfp pilus assembly ATPase PilU